MRITSLAVRNLGRHRDAKWLFDPRMTVVRGPNESGKSTLQRAIELVLTRPATSTAPDLAALRTWGAGPDEAISVAITFTWEDEDGSARHGRLAKVFAGAAGTTRLELDGEAVSDAARAEEMVAELSGVPTEGFLRSTASVRQVELAALERSETALRERLAATLSGADRSTLRARGRLAAALDELAPPGGGPGRLATARDAVADTERRLAAGEEALAQLERDRETLVAAAERARDARAAVAERRALLDKARQAERHRSERDDAEARRDRYTEAIGIHHVLAELERTHPSPLPLGELRRSAESLRSLESRIAALEEMLSSEVRVEFEVPPERRWRSRLALGLALLAIGLAAAAGGIAAALTAGFTPGVAVGALGVLAALVGLVLYLTARRARSDSAATRHMRDEEVARRLRGRSDMEQELRLNSAERDELLDRLGLPGMAEVEERLAAETAHVARVDTARTRLSVLVGDEGPDALAPKRDAAVAEIARAEAALEALGPIANEPRARERLEAEVRDAEGVADRARDDEAAARARVDQNPVDADEVSGLAERLAVWRRELAALGRRERLMSRTLDELDAAERATMARATRFLERRMAGDLARVTGGRYREVRIDDADLGFEVLPADGSAWVSAADLSRGALDAVYLAARLGLVRLVAGDRRPPLLMDDPLVTLDDERAGHAMAVIRDLTPDFQVICLTASDRLDGLADRVIVLEGPEAVADS